MGWEEEMQQVKHISTFVKRMDFHQLVLKSLRGDCTPGKHSEIDDTSWTMYL